MFFFHGGWLIELLENRYTEDYNKEYNIMD